MTLTVQSVRSVSFGMLIEQISFGANFMLIGPQENVSLTTYLLANLAAAIHQTGETTQHHNEQRLIK